MNTPTLLLQLAEEAELDSVLAHVFLFHAIIHQLCTCEQLWLVQVKEWWVEINRLWVGT